MNANYYSQLARHSDSAAQEEQAARIRRRTERLIAYLHARLSAPQTVEWTKDYKNVTIQLTYDIPESTVLSDRDDFALVSSVMKQQIGFEVVDNEFRDYGSFRGGGVRYLHRIVLKVSESLPETNSTTPTPNKTFADIVVGRRETYEAEETKDRVNNFVRCIKRALVCSPGATWSQSQPATVTVDRTFDLGTFSLMRKADFEPVKDALHAEGFITTAVKDHHDDGLYKGWASIQMTKATR